MIEIGAVVAERYRIVRLMGEGGMGAVYEAEHTGVGRRLAVKVLHETFAKNQAMVDRFQREARAAAAIGHDHIVDVIDFGIFESAPFMVMEYLKGESLGDRLDRVHAIEVGAAVYILAQVLSALSVVHAVGIVHRDLKPDNVFLVTNSGYADFVKLLDFGIAKLHADEVVKPRSGNSLTASGVMIGTPAYMAPEQALAKRDIDQRADVYSAGVMLYEMVTGVLPFDATSQVELLMDIVYRPNGLKSPREMNETVSEEFSAIVLKAMAREREDRYQTADELLAAIEPFVVVPAADVSGDGTGRSDRPVANGGVVTPLDWEAPKRRSGSSTHPHVAPSRIQKEGRAILPAVGALALMIASGVAMYAIRGRDSSSHRQAVALASSRGARLSAEIRANALVAIDLQQLPAGAVVSVDNRVAASTRVLLPRGTSHVIRVSAPGRVPYVATVLADRDRTIVVILAAIEAPIIATPPAHTEPVDAEVPAGTLIAARTPQRTRAVTRNGSTVTTNANRSRSRSNRNGLLPVSNEY